MGAAMDNAAAVPYGDVVKWLAGPLSQRVYRVWQGPALAEYVLASNRRRQVWHACLSHLSPALDDAQGRALYPLFTACKDRELLNRALGDCPAGLIKALGKLGPRALQPVSYVCLARIMRGRHGARTVAHLPRLNQAQIARLAQLPDGFRRPAIIAALRDRYDGRRLPELLEAVTRLRPDVPTERLGRDLAQAADAEAMTRHLIKLLEARPFPPPPLTIPPPMRALESAEAVADAAERFRNCARNYLRDVQERQLYFYEWQGEGPALISLRIHGLRGWVIDEVQGPGNTTVPPGIMAAIVDKLTAAGVGNDPAVTGVGGEALDSANAKG